MKPTDNFQDSIELKNLTDALVSIDFTQDEANYQVDQLGQAIASSVTSEILKTDEKIKELSDNELALKDYLNNPSVAEKIQKTTRQVSEQLFNDYIQNITTDLPEDKKRVFYSIIKKQTKLVNQQKF